MTSLKIYKRYKATNRVTLYSGDCIALLKQIPDQHLNLIVTSPPYNIGKEYEKQSSIQEYVTFQEKVISLCVKKLHPKGSICWQVGNSINKGKKGQEVVPLDIVLYEIFKKNRLLLKNRIIWHFRHGLHAKHRFSGRYETVMWFTKSDDYIFNLDNVRVRQKYPGKKAYKGPKKGQYSGNIKGKNPSDFWDDLQYDVWDMPNVKANHIEKTSHPCQYPISLVERLINATTNKGDIVFDPFLGAGTTIIAAIKNGRRAVGSELNAEYYEIAKERIQKFNKGDLPIREDKPTYEPAPGTAITMRLETE
tara:strand:+ start:111 stop:1028 length:918 start_codon:yes stop_codon:yes gene_type:complete